MNNQTMHMDAISFEDFKKVEIKIGTILKAERVEGSEKLLALQVDFGQEQRQIIAGIGQHYQPEDIAGKQCPFVFNLPNKIIKGMESQGMILCADDEKPVLIHPDAPTHAGSIIK